MIARALWLVTVSAVLLQSGCATTADPGGSSTGSGAQGGSAGAAAGASGGVALTAGAPFGGSASAGSSSAGAPGAAGSGASGSAGSSTGGVGSSGSGGTGSGSGGTGSGSGGTGSGSGGTGSGMAGNAGASSAAGSAGSAGGTAATGDIAGKITVGYQGWFNAANDGSNINPPWWHWSPDRNLPTPQDTGIKSWPDVTEFTTTYASGFGNLGNGSPAKLYSNWDKQTVDAQIKWMQDTGIDTIALQRFGDFRGTGEARNVVAGNVRDAAQAHARKFYIMYDISGWDTFQSDLKSDWTDHIVGELHLTDSTAYAKQNGKPVVCIWGLGYSGHPGTPETTLDIINYFKNKGMYVIGGLGNDWRTADGTRWSKAGYLSVFDALDAVSPWMVGVIGDNAGSDSNRKNYNEGDVTYLHGKGKHYQPCILPGDLQGHQRHHGEFMWHQFYNMIQIGSDGLYISMYDEYNEGNQIAKTAANAQSVPTGSGILTLDEDGTACSADYYLRLTADGGKMLRKQIPLAETRPTSPM